MNVRRVRLGEVCGSDRVIVDPLSELAKSLPYLGLEQIESGTGRISRMKTAEGIEEGISSSFRFDARHVLYGKLRPYLNKVALPESEGRCTTEIIPLLPSELIDREYLAMVLRSDAFVAAGQRSTAGSRMPRANLDELFRFEFDLPAKGQQREFVGHMRAKLHSIEAARSAAQTQLKDASLIVGASLKEEFLHSVPVRSINGVGSPQGWHLYRLTELARLESGHTPSRRRPEWWSGKMPWLSLPDIRKLHGQFAYETLECTNEAGIANSSARMLPVGTVCVSRTASIGFVTILGKPMATSQDFCNWICDPEKLDPEFLMYAFMASQDALRELGSGAVHKTIYMPTIQSFHVCAPDIAEQRRITRSLRERLAAAEALTAGLKARLADIERLPQRLLAAAFGAA